MMHQATGLEQMERLANMIKNVEQRFVLLTSVGPSFTSAAEIHFKALLRPLVTTAGVDSIYFDTIIREDDRKQMLERSKSFIDRFKATNHFEEMANIMIRED